MTRGVIGRTVLGLWLGCITATAQLPPDVLVDKYVLQAHMLSEEQDHKGALEAMDRVVELQKEHDLRLSAEFPFHYARMALAAGAVQAAVESAKRYLSAAGRKDKHYREALELLVKAERKMQESAVERVGPTPVKPDLETQLKAAAPQSPQAQEAVDCSDWNTKQFFWRATVEDVTTCVNTGADVNGWDGGVWAACTKCTPLHRAALHSQSAEVIAVLVDLGARIDARNGTMKHCTECEPLHLAALHNENVEVVKALIKEGADPNSRDRGGRTPLHFAAYGNKNAAVIETLIKAGADPRARDDLSNTPLHVAAMVNEPPVVMALLEANSDQKALTKWGKTPLQVARKRNRKVLRNALARLTESQKAAHRARARQKNPDRGGATPTLPPR